MNAKEIAIIEAIIDKSDLRRHEKALKLLLYGEDRNGSFVKNEYVNCLETLVRKKFGNGVSFHDAYSIFATEFWLHLEKMPPEQLRGINNLKSWLFTVAKNYIETIRKEIEAFQQVDAPIDEGKLTGNVDVSGEDECDLKGNSTENDPVDSKVDGCQERIREPESEEMVSFDEDEQERLERTDFAQWRFRYYLSKMINETYRDLLSAVYIEGVDRETLAEEYGWGADVLNLTLDHARNAFIAVTLDDIRRCGPQLFEKYECHEDMDDKTADLLREFFVNKYDVQQLANLHHKTNYEMKKALAVAYKKLLRIHKNETELIEREHYLEDKRQKRMRRLFGIYKGVLKKGDSQSYWLLQKFFEEFQGDSAAMTEWALNNGTDVNEMERQLETGFDALNAIDKGCGHDKNSLNDEKDNN